MGLGFGGIGRFEGLGSGSGFGGLLEGLGFMVWGVSGLGCGPYDGLYKDRIRFYRSFT